MHRNRGYPPLSSALTLVKAVRNESKVKEKFLKEFEAKKKKERELEVRVEELRYRWAEFKGRIEKAFLESSSDETERLAQQVRSVEKDLNERLERNRHLSQGIGCLLRIYCIVKKYNEDSQNIRTRIEDLVDDINKYITKGQIAGYYSALANSFDLVYDSYMKHLDRRIQCKKELLVENTTDRDRIIFLRRLLTNDIEKFKTLLDNWENNLISVKELGYDDLYVSTHLKICIPHFVEIYSDLSTQEPPKNIRDQVEKINYLFIHMKSIVQELNQMEN